MIRTKSGLPRYCGWNTDHHGKRRVRFRKAGFSTYLSGTPWGEDFMRGYAAALDGVTAQTSNIGAGRTVSGTVNALVAAYLDPNSSSRSRPGLPKRNAAAETFWKISVRHMETSRYFAPTRVAGGLCC